MAAAAAQVIPLVLLRLVLAVQVVAVQVVELQQAELLALQILAAAVALVELQMEAVAQVAQAYLLFLTLAHKEAQVAQSHQAVATPSIHLHHQALSRLDFYYLFFNTHK
jgi:hypothetical protein